MHKRTTKQGSYFQAIPGALGMLTQDGGWEVAEARLEGAWFPAAEGLATFCLWRSVCLTGSSSGTWTRARRSSWNRAGLESRAALLIANDIFLVSHT